MATFTKRANGWQAQVRKQGYPPKSKVFLKKSDAETWARQIESEMDRGQFFDRSEAEKTTLYAVLERYRTEISVTKRGWREESSRLANLRKHSIAKKSLANLSSSDIVGYREGRIKVVSPTTVNKELALLSRVIDTARKDWGIYLPDNAAKKVRRPKPNRGRDRRLEPGEEVRILVATGSLTLRAIVRLALETGMRRGELAGITWDCVDLSKCTLHIPKTKTDSPRTIPLSTKAVEVLKNLPRNIGGSVFNLKASSMSQAFERACRRAGISGLCFHDLRHEAVTRLFEKGLNPMQVAAISGHKTMDMLKRYTHLRAESLVALLG
ncbi:MAG TPA: site-specific integrase [Burkholderiaceae bacterium]|jgi:integrase